MVDSKKPAVSAKKPASVKKPASAKKAAPAKKAASAAKPASRASKPASRGAAAAEPVDPTVRNMRDPWFTLVVTGAKTRHVHWAEPKPPMPGRPSPPGFENLAEGDIITWRNTSLGFPRLFKVKVTKVMATTTAKVVEQISGSPTMMKAVFPTLTDVEQVKVALGGMAKSPVDKKLVIFEFKAAA